MASSLLAKSAQGATFLILLQVGSRALTFVVNQVLLRYLSPMILGVATQLELFSISTLYFSRESIRVTLQRQRNDTEPKPPTKEDSQNGKIQEANSDLPSRKIQESVNLSYLAITLGLPLTLLFKYLYVRNANTAVLSTSQIHHSLNIYALATIIELCNEPLFAISQQKLLYGTRASAEMRATFTRCIVTCTTAIWASRSSLDLGVLPFAIGQLSYAIVLTCSYLYTIYPLSTSEQISLLPLPLTTTKGQTRHFLPRPLLKLASTLYGQSLFKQLLTSGDSYLIAALTTLSSQGAYALASNYGSLFARILFQPIEESSRSLFARLLLPSPSSPSSPSTSKPPAPTRTQKAHLKQATNYLHLLLHAYTLLALLLSLAPPLAPLLLSLLAGPRWSNTEAPFVLAAYIYYIPLLALNGILDAYVAAVATPAQLRVQSIWMVGFSCVFAVVGGLVLGVWEGGARALVGVNSVVMVLRIIWGWRFVKADLKGRGGGTSGGNALPHVGSSVVAGLGRAGVEWVLRGGGDLGIWEVGLLGGVVAGAGLGILCFESEFFVECYLMLQPPPERSGEVEKEG